MKSFESVIGTKAKNQFVFKIPNKKINYQKLFTLKIIFKLNIKDIFLQEFHQTLPSSYL